MTRPPFHYQDDNLHCEDVPLATIAAEVGTPTYVYSKQAITGAYLADCQVARARADTNDPTLAAELWERTEAIVRGL